MELEKIRELKSRVDDCMAENNNLSKWDRYKATVDFNEIVTEFKDTLWDKYPEMSLASAYFQKPCFFNED